LSSEALKKIKNKKNKKNKSLIENPQGRSKQKIGQGKNMCGRSHYVLFHR